MKQSNSGGARPGAGRKPKDKARADKRLMVRLTADQWDKIAELAIVNSKAVSEQARCLIVERLL